MEKGKNEWLKHLEHAVPVTGYGRNLSMYTIALEGWRRGLTLKVYPIIKDNNRLILEYSLSNTFREHKFSVQMGDKITSEAIRICKEKDVTKEYLSKANVLIPTGKRFSEEALDEEIIKFAKELGFPLVLKPTNKLKGQGVIVNIQDVPALREALLYVRKELGYTDVIIEQFISGEEYRIYVMGNRVIGAINKTPANIVGDGINTIEKLIDLKNQSRKRNPFLSNRPIIINKEVLDLLEETGYMLESVPKNGEQVFLTKKSNLSSGGDPIDYTDALPIEIKNTAIKAAQAIPGLTQCGIDMIVDRNNSGVVIEINTSAGLGGHLFPTEGKARDIPKEMIDDYFPETINTNKTMLYFDFNSIVAPIRNRTVKEVILTPPPLGKIYAKKYLVYGKVQGVDYRNWIRKKASEKNLNGYTKNLKNGTLVVVVAGTDKNDVDGFKYTCLQGSDKSAVEKVTEHDWEKPVKMGFEIKKESNERHLKKLENDLQKEKDEKQRLEQENESMHREMERMNQEIQRAALEKESMRQEKQKVTKEKDNIERKYIMIQESRTWRYTQPIRNMLDFLRGTNKSQHRK